MDASNTASPKAADAVKAVLSIKAINNVTLKDRLRGYIKNPFSGLLFLLVSIAALVTFAVLLFLIGYILVRGVPHLTLSLFEWEYTTTNVSMMPAIVNTFTMVILALIIAGPLGIFSAVYLVEYAGSQNRLIKVVRMTAETLAGIPSIVFGLFGYLFFVVALGWGFSLLAGAFTLSIMILPLVMRTTEEALMSVPISYREGSFALGAGKLRTIFRIVLPSAVPGILAGIILATGRVVGETAALMFTAGSFAQIPGTVMGAGRTLAVHMYSLANEGLHVNQASATAVVLLIMVLLINWFSATVAKKITR